MTDPSHWRSLAAKALPRGTHRRDYAEMLRRASVSLREGVVSAAESVGRDNRTAPIGPTAWLAAHHRRNESAEVRLHLAGGPRKHGTNDLTVVLDARDSLAEAEKLTLDSLRAQWSDEWSSTSACSTDQLRLTIEEIASQDPTVPVMVLRAGDRLRPDMVARVLDACWEAPGLRMVHWDETAGTRGTGLRFRPSWSPDLLLSANPYGRAFAMRAADWVDFDPDLGAGAWWDVLLRASLDAHEVRRLTRVGMIASPWQTSVPDATALVGAEVERRGWPALPVAGPDAVALEWDLERWPKVSIVVPTRHNRPLLSTLLPSLAATDYPDLEVMVVDNSGRSADKEAWYAQWADRLELSVRWWGEPFNYSAVNNLGAAEASGEVIVFLNDDTEARSPQWLRTMVGWATRPDIGTVGAQLIDPDGLIQHGGVVLGMDGSAGHLFAGCEPGSDSLLGRTDWNRNVLASTGACLALRREVFEELGGFDERFELCGSDVVLGLASHVAGYRNVVVAGTGMLHLESATRGPTSGVAADLFASWWHYQRWVTGGDPYYSPSLSLDSGRPRLRPPGEQPAKTRMLESMGRPVHVFRQELHEETATELALAYPVGDEVARAVRDSHARSRGSSAVRTLNWILPSFENPFYGGLATVLRIAEKLLADHGVQQRFVVLDHPHPEFYRSAIAAFSEALGTCEVVFLGGDGLETVDRIPTADAVIATMWTTAYVAAVAASQGRRFYLVQDFEPCFYPAGTMYALAEETYRLGLYGICNTEPIHRMYTQRYGGTAGWFLPAVDREVFHPPSVLQAGAGVDGDPVRVFVYARPGHWRNCWEIARPALESIKTRYGKGVHIVTAGSWASPEDLGGGIEHLGLLDVASTGELYRTCDVGVALTVSEHPSYLPAELMACGVPVVAFDLPEADWILRHGETGLRARQTVEGLREQLDRIVGDAGLRRRLAQGALAQIDSHHSDWGSALGGVWDLLCDPESVHRGLSDS